MRSVLFLAALLGLGALLSGAPLARADEGGPTVVLRDGFGTPDGAIISGRAVGNKRGYEPGARSEGPLGKLLRSVALFRPKPVANATVDVRIGPRRFSVSTDARGHFELELSREDLRGLGVKKHPARARVRGSRAEGSWSEAQLFLWPRNGTLVVSDIDDTVLRSNVDRKVKLVLKTLFGNAHDLKPFAGAPRLFRRIADSGTPILFLTSSPTNLYARLRKFFRESKFPRAPMLMKRLGPGLSGLGSHVDYKLGQLERVAELFPNYDFAVLGDSGQKDREVYKKWAKRIGRHRIRFAGIRDVGDEARKRKRRYARQTSFRSFRELARLLEKRRLIPRSRARGLRRKGPAAARPRSRWRQAVDRRLLRRSRKDRGRGRRKGRVRAR